MDKQQVRLETLPFMLLIDAGNVLESALGKRLLAANLGVAQARILELLHISSGPLTPGQLAALLLQEPHSVSGLLNRLDDRGLITRSRTRQDRRKVLVGLTTEGSALAVETMAISRELAREARALFGGAQGPDALQLLTGFLERGLQLADINDRTRNEALRLVWE